MLPCELCELLGGKQVVGRRISFHLDVFVFVIKPIVVHLQGERAGVVGDCSVFEVQDFDGFCADGLGNGHAGAAGLGVDNDFAACPFVVVEFGFEDVGEILSAVVEPFAVIPVAAVGNLELHAAECIHPFVAGGRASAKTSTHA